MPDATANKVGAVSVAAGILMPTVFAALFTLGMVEAMTDKEEVVTAALGSSVTYALGAVAVVCGLFGPIFAVILGCSARKTLPGKIGLGLGLYGVWQLLVVAALGIAFAMGKFPK